jgi:hypothetical protein
MPSDTSRVSIALMLQNCCALMAMQHETFAPRADVIVRDEH